MRNKFHSLTTIFAIFFSFTFLNGCTFIFQKGRRVDTEKITKLQSELSDLERAKAELEDRLKNEIGDKDVTVEMLERGLVVTFVAEVLFDAGKADLRKDASPMIEKVAKVLEETVPDLNVGIEGHTDSDPIQRSGWKSNWELSTARALSVLHFLVGQENIDPQRLAATGYGEYRPVMSNATREGKQKNRRVEIVILPKTTTKGRE